MYRIFVALRRTRNGELTRDRVEVMREESNVAGVTAEVAGPVTGRCQLHRMGG